MRQVDIELEVVERSKSQWNHLQSVTLLTGYGPIAIVTSGDASNKHCRRIRLLQWTKSILGAKYNDNDSE